MPSLTEMVLNRWSRRSAPGRDEEVAQHADRFLQWAKQEYHQQFLDWLYEQGDAPVPVRGSHADLLAGTARANTYKEIRHHLLDQAKKANAVLDREQDV